jgi:hypothetical protein
MCKSRTDTDGQRRARRARPRTHTDRHGWSGAGTKIRATDTHGSTRMVRGGPEDPGHGHTRIDTDGQGAHEDPGRKHTRIDKLVPFCRPTPPLGSCSSAAEAIDLSQRTSSIRINVHPRSPAPFLSASRDRWRRLRTLRPSQPTNSPTPTAATVFDDGVRVS